MVIQNVNYIIYFIWVRNSRKFDIMICIPIINYQIQYKSIRKLSLMRIYSIHLQ